MATSFYLHHESVLTEQLYEGIPAGHASCRIKQSLDYQIQLGASQTRIILAVIACLLNYKRLYGILGKLVVAFTVVI